MLVTWNSCFEEHTMSYQDLIDYAAGEFTSLYRTCVYCERFQSCEGMRRPTKKGKKAKVEKPKYGDLNRNHEERG